MKKYMLIAAGLAVARLQGGRRIALLATLLALQAGSAALAMPDPLSFFNGIAGCRGVAAIRCLDDSNIDAGQNVTRIWPAVKDRLGPYERNPRKVRDELETLARNEAPGLGADTVQALDGPEDGTQRWRAWRCRH